MKQPYVRFAIILVVSLMLMFLLSMSQIRTFDHFYLNLSNLWMALLMVSVMAVVMLVGMSAMFSNRRVTAALVVGFLIGAGLLFYAARTQPLVGNRQFLESMIPHHSRAILVCQEAQVTDPEIIELCKRIVEAQRAEIEQMTRILERY
jgi:uncharacterized protein (DUF305 family)